MKLKLKQNQSVGYTLTFVTTATIWFQYLELFKRFRGETLLNLLETLINITSSSMFCTFKFNILNLLKGSGLKIELLCRRFFSEALIFQRIDRCRDCWVIWPLCIVLANIFFCRTRAFFIGDYLPLGFDEGIYDSNLVPKIDANCGSCNMVYGSFCKR